MMRLDKYLSEMSVGTRKEVKELIKNKRVSVNGVTVRNSDLKVSESDEIMVDGEVVSYLEYEYILLYKPSGYLTATEDKRDPVVMELVDSRRKDLFPVGRLDKDTEGVLLITNDGVMAHDLLLPKNHVKKKYYVEVENVLPADAREQFATPMEFREFTSSPAEYENISDKSAYLTISEGKFHQVKRMFERIGCPVTYLKRVRFDELTLDGLEKGECRPLSDDEIKRLKSVIGKNS